MKVGLIYSLVNDVLQVIKQGTSNLAKLLLFTYNGQNVSEPFRLDIRVDQVLLVVFTKQKADVLAHHVLDAEVSCIFGAKQQRPIHHELNGLRGARLSSWDGQLVVYVKGRDKETLFSVIVRWHEDKSDILVCINVILKLNV